MSLEEYTAIVDHAIERGAKQVNILGGEPLLHSGLGAMCAYNAGMDLKTTIYTNGTLLHTWLPHVSVFAKLRVSIYGETGIKGLDHLYVQDFPHVFDANFMVGVGTTCDELLNVAEAVEEDFHCKVFFISSIRQLDNHQDFFQDSPLTLPILEYKELVHKFLHHYEGNMEIHISKRGVFESTQSLPHCKCKFVNRFIGGGIIQCPYDVVNLMFQDDYRFDFRDCQQNNTCLMSKIVVRRRLIDA
jgi:MoaA/NifB/PqqE/SkfB family radical SAM enzyme